MVYKIEIPEKDLLDLQEKYPDDERGFRALAYFIYTEYSKANGFNFRQTINQLKMVREKLKRA